MEPHLKSAHHPRVSVVMPVYNGEKYLREAVDSILMQTFTDYELIIIDDNSTDRTADILRAHPDERIKLIKNDQNCGISLTLNRGISTAQGEYIARMDCDDICSPERFMAQVQFLDENPSIDIVGSWLEIIDQNSKPTEKMWKYIRPAMGLRWVTFFNIPVAHPAVMVRRRIFDFFAAQYDVSEEPAEDYGLWTRINLKIRFSNIQSALLKYRVHEFSISKARNTRQYETACKISQKTISSYLRNPISLETINLIRMPYQAHSLEEFNSAIRVLHQLYQKFRKDHSLGPSEIAYINLDLAKKFIRISRKNYQFSSSWLVYFSALNLAIRTLIFDLVKNNHYEFSRMVQAMKDAGQHARRPIAGQK